MNGPNGDPLSIYAKIVVAVNAISTIASTFVACMIIGIRCYNKEIVNRVSIRLTLAMAVTDIFYSIFQVWNLFSTTRVSCVLSTWGVLLTTLAFNFLSVTVALNLQLIFLHDRRNLKLREQYYFIVDFGGAFFITVLPVVFGRVGLKPDGTCWFLDTWRAKGILWETATYLMWICMGVLYCLVAVTMVVWKLHQQRKQLSRLIRLSPDTRVMQQEKMLIRMAMRIVFHALVPIASQTPRFILELMNFLGVRPRFPLVLIVDIAAGLQGTLNAIVFLFDPAIHAVWYEFRKRLTSHFMVEQYVFTSSTRSEWVKTRIKSFLVLNNGVQRPVSGIAGLLPPLEELDDEFHLTFASADDEKGRVMKLL
ncbi:hypothetical protein K493DRAFT_359834 [Basidiobolus meristosporus CBS 931.73]|uniref:G-protein coupled receptors family 2 profile 2 domain-containing protein n=1 Tax=Basidiobolus meristosporus CBS 931.73 TaxID=1314790 RepID=A0A1Y1XPG1_9FUNG|nr:hypothetical protein K493DRAFT_359834 [Basidiobolus meristosporus CBS 931.73]|eukprot:ORX87633.1 hypothetical protein K493DRAFT_359834 [Basidiobolus meristosporus CBS 931.73]